MLKYLADLTKDNYPFLLGRQTGMIDLLLDPNNGGIKMDLNNVQEGKKYIKTKVHYKVRSKPGDILEDSAIGDICDTGTEPQELSVDVEISKRLGTAPKQFSNSNMINICQDTDAFVREYLVSDMRAMREKADEYLLAKVESYKGRNILQAGGETAPGKNTVIKLLGNDAAGNKVPLFANYADIRLNYIKNELNGTPMVIGEGYFQKFMELQKYSCCNAPGVDYTNAIVQAGAAFYLDQAANRIIGNNEIMVIAPNTVHLLWFNENRNININNQLVQHIVIPDPVYPQLGWNLDFKWDECDKLWKYQLSAWLDVFSAIQTNAFGADNSPSTSTEDELAGMTGVFGYTITSD